jgi:branched-chain amino acid transport system ATP-binding protein
VLRGFEDGADLFGALSIGATPGLAAIGLGLILLATMIAMPNGLTGGREAGELPWIRRRPAGPSSLPEPDGHAVGMSTSEPSARGTLSARGITLAFSGLEVLKGVDVELQRGEALGLIGPNGAGKTTLVNILSGFQEPDSGSVSMDGVDVSRRSPTRLARDGLGRTFQAALPFPDMSSIENVAVGAMGVGVGRRRAGAAAVEVLDRLGLLELASLPAGSLPPASQRLLGIARALAIRPRYLLLDEPAAGLTGSECDVLVSILRNVLEDFGCGILLIEHDMSVVMSFCPRVQVLDDGMTLKVGAPEEIQADPAVIEAYLGSSFMAAADA